MLNRKSWNRIAGLGALTLALAALVACKGKEQAEKPTPVTTPPVAAATPPAYVGPTPVQDALDGAARPSLLLAQAWFWKDEQGRPKPGPARLDIWRPGSDGVWSRTRLEDSESNVFHKAIAYDGGVLTIGAEKANLKLWTFADGKWTGKTLWTKSWGGKFNRLRDIEIGDVDGDGKDEFVIATHDAGVVAVYNPPDSPDGQPTVIEMDQKADTFVHEIEIADIDGDGKLEFFATPTDRNQANSSQGGMMVMYRWDGASYVRSVVDPMGHTHAKEILANDLDGDGKAELFAVLEAETDDAKNIVKPVEIRQYFLQPDGSFTYVSIASIDDRQTRFLVPGDFDGDGKKELVAAAMKKGIFYLRPPSAEALAAAQKAGQPTAPWTVTSFNATSSGFEHACYAADLDGDNKLELYVAGDEQQELRRYDYDPVKKEFNSTLLGRIDPDTLTWNITVGTL